MRKQLMKENNSKLRVRLLFSLWILLAGAIELVLLMVHDIPYAIALKDASLSTFLMIVLGQILYQIQHNFHPAKPLNYVNFGLLFVFSALFKVKPWVFSSWLFYIFWRQNENCSCKSRRRGEDV